jgi:hypothetical protein
MKYYSVTEVLSPYFLLDVPKDQRHFIERHLETAKERGKKVHAACGSYALGLWIAPLPAEWQGYFESFKTWFDNFVDRVFFVEKRFQCDSFFYTGRIDLGVRLIDRREMIVDLKTPLQESPTWCAQLAAYLTLIIESIETEMDGVACMALKLDPGGTSAKAIVYQYSDDDFAAFLSALNAFRYFSK